VKKLDVEYDPWSDVLTIEGFRYSGVLFRDLAGGLQKNRWFQIVSRDDGVITIRQAAIDARIAEDEKSMRALRNLLREYCAVTKNEPWSMDWQYEQVVQDAVKVLGLKYGDKL